jgi:hypothetical protein
MCVGDDGGDVIKWNPADFVVLFGDNQNASLYGEVPSVSFDFHHPSDHARLVASRTRSDVARGLF